MSDFVFRYKTIRSLVREHLYERMVLSYCRTR